MKKTDMNPSGPTEEASQRSPFLILVAIIIIGSFLRLYKLGIKNFWLDEYIMRSYVGFNYNFLWNNPYLDGNISYPTMVQKFFFELFPESEFYMRLPTAIFSIASLFTLYLLGKAIYSSREGIAAALLLAFSSYHINMAQEFKLAYMVSTTLYPLAIFSLVKGMEKGYLRYWIIFIISVLSLFYMHFLTIPGIFSLITWVSLTLILLFLKPVFLQNMPGYTPSYKPFLKFAVSLVIIFTGYIPMLSVLITLFHSPYGFDGKNSSSIPFRQSANMDFFKQLFIEYSGSQILLLIFAVFVISWLITSMRDNRNIFVGGFLFSCIFLPFAAYWVINPSPPLYTRYFIYLLPVYLLIVAKGIVSLIDLLLSRWSILVNTKLYITILLVFGINLFNINHLWSYYQNERSVYNDVSLYLLSKIENRDVLFFEDKYEIEGLLYHLDKNGSDKIYISSKTKRYFPYPPYFFRPMDKRGLLTPDLNKKGIFIYYTWEEDIEHLIKSLPNGFRFWFISRKQHPDFLRFSTDKWEYSQHNENFFIYFGQR